MADRTTRDRMTAAGRTKSLETIQVLEDHNDGDNMRDVAVTEGDKVNNYGVNDLVPVIDQVPDVQVVDLVTD